MLQKAVVISVALMGTACGVGDPGTGSIGELGEGVFTYNCVGDGDAVCNVTEAVDTAEVDFDLGLNGEIPAAIAVGARFDLSFWGDVTTDEGELLFVETVPASDEHVRIGGGFMIEASGTFAFLARSPKGFVVDFTHLTAFDTSALEVWHEEQRVSSLSLLTGREIELAVVPRDVTGVALAGALPFTWQSSDESLLRIAAVDSVGTPESGLEQNDDEVRIVAIAAGSAELSISAGDVQQIIVVTIADDPEETP